MAHATESQHIDGAGKHVLILDQEDYSALSSLLYDLADEPRLREIARHHRLALGGNQIESIAALWSKISR